VLIPGVCRPALLLQSSYDCTQSIALKQTQHCTGYLTYQMLTSGRSH
jgi:hypothetical protein